MLRNFLFLANRKAGTCGRIVTSLEARSELTSTVALHPRLIAVAAFEIRFPRKEFSPMWRP